MPSIVVVGANWGDEGKGRIVDFLAADASASIRFQGGNNAGHTVVNDYGTFKLHQLPSGIFNPNCIAVLGPGMVISPEALSKEIAEFQQEIGLKYKIRDAVLHKYKASLMWRMRCLK